MSRKTICLVMIVKNEAHVILDTLRHILTYVPIDSWCISDTGSTDSTKKDIAAFFKERRIPGEIYDTEWRDFGYNRTVAFQKAFNKSDYVFVWDADDEIRGTFAFPKQLEADSYKCMFGNELGLRYERVQLFNNRKRWEYVGVLHEYPRCIEPCGPPVDVAGDYYFFSGRSGARNKNPNKYQDDARILEAAYKEAIAKKDQIHKRYAFYCAQSFCSARMDEKAIEYYKIVLTLDTWLQEKYMSCLSLYESYVKLGREIEGLVYLVESYKYDPNRVECYYRLVKYYCIHGPPEVAYAYYKLIEPYYENQFPRETFAEKLFVNKEDYEFYLPYYMTIVGDKIQRPDISAHMFSLIMKYKYTGCSAWWIHNVFTNLQFCVDILPYNLEFLKDLFDYVDALRDQSIILTASHNETLAKIITRYAPLIVARPAILPTRVLGLVKPRVILTMTTCKRYQLFEKTVNSVLNMWSDVGSIDSFFCVDDNSLEEDRATMRATFPFFEYYMKTPAERGHRESMNIIWNHLDKVKPTYWIHLEDDWMYFHQGGYVERAIKFLDKYESKNIHQLVFNRNYGVVYKDLERTGGIVLERGFLLHEKRDDLPGHHCGYWPHYSLQPSISRVRAILEVGPYDSEHRFFERGQGDKYFAKGFLTGFFNSIFSTHIGKQHWEKEGMNAYALNDVGQFITTAAPAEVVNEPLEGTMQDHLEAILGKIQTKRPFGLIRPSDGEHSILLNRTLTNCDNWTFWSGGILQKQLAESIQTIDPNLYIGIPCNSCKKPWNCTPEIYGDFMGRIPLGQRTYANIFGNSNWPRFIEFIKGHPGFYLVTSGTTESELPIKGRCLINEKLVDSWDKVGPTETERILQFIRGKREELICFSAGPLAKIWIPLCMKENPGNMYVDVGGSLDSFTKSKASRLYTDLAHPFSKESCAFIVETEKPVPILNMLDLLTKYTGPSYKGQQFSVTPAMCRRYTWGEGYIHFSLGGMLHTTWKEGKHRFLDAVTAEAKWESHAHIIRFNDTYDAYTAIHMDTQVISTGVIEPESAYVYDDCIDYDVKQSDEVLLDKDATRSLIYACVFHKRAYLDLLKILLASYKFFSRTDAIDFVVFTSKDFEAEIVNFGKMIGVPIECQIFDFTTMHESSCARLYIFDYAKIHLYHRALYLDTDVIIQGDLQRLFELEIGDRIYALTEGTIDHEIHGGWFFDFRTIDPATPALNGGIMLFKVADAIRTKFRAVIGHIERTRKRGGRVPECLDQPFLNYHFIKDGIHDMELLKQYAAIYCCDPPPPPSIPTDVSICHFVWPLGNAEHKRKRMEAHLSHILINYRNVFGITGVFNPTAIIGKRYSWMTGFIEFSTGGLLNTKWGAGRYYMLDAQTVYVTWYLYSHLIKMNEAFTTYQSFRIGDVFTSCGELETNPIYIYGDSHAMLLFDKLAIPNRNRFEYAKTMHSVGRDSVILNFDQKHVNQFTTVCLVYGEVDVRCHIGKQMSLGRELKGICKGLVDAYLKAVSTLITTYKRIIIVGIPPPADPKDHTHSHADGKVLPFVGTNADRIFYTSLMNSYLELGCLEYGYTFFAPYEFYTREDGCLNYDYSDGCIHIGDTQYFLDEFAKLL